MFRPAIGKKESRASSGFWVSLSIHSRPIGPAIALASSIPDPGKLRIESRLNGQIMQNSTTAELIFEPEMLLSYISEVLTIEPGDLLFTGTPAGVGVARSPQVFLKPGDCIEVHIEMIGTLSNRCVGQ